MPTFAEEKPQLIFVVCAPRSGSTLLQRMIGSHSAIYTHPEPHLITPLAYLGYYDTVRAAPYDHINAGAALRELVQELPGGEEDYLAALRAYTDTIYQRVLTPSGRRIFLDKTPAYGLILPFLLKLYPTAKYVVLTRHPLAILHSQVHSFFAGDYRAALRQNPIVSDYVPAIAEFLRDSPAGHVHVRYEDIVADPEHHMRRIAEYLEVPFEEGMVEYGRQEHISKSYGDPLAVERHQRPVTISLAQWAQDLAAKPEDLRRARKLISTLSPGDLQAWGYPDDELFDPVDALVASGGGQRTKAVAFSTYRLKRAVMLALRRPMRSATGNNALRKLRYYCDVLLRE